MAASDSKRSAELDILKDSLYEQATQHGSEARTFTQNELLDFNIIPSDSIELLVQVIQGLVNDYLFVATQDRGAIAWRWRPRDDAKKYALDAPTSPFFFHVLFGTLRWLTQTLFLVHRYLDLPTNELRMVYSYIDEAGREGMWIRTMKNRLKMHDTVMKTCLKQLEAKGYVRQFSSVLQQNKRVYIKVGLEPSEQATGGPWFTSGELDAAFIDALLNFVFEHIKARGAYLSAHAVGPTRAPRKGVIRGDPGADHGAAATAAAGTKRRAGEMSEESHGAAAAASSSAATAAAAAAAPTRYRKGYLPLPAGYRSYPTVTEIAQRIHDVGLTKNTTLSRDDVQQLVDILVYDGLIEPITVGKRKGYRCARVTKQDPSVLARRAKREREAASGMDEEGDMGLLEQHQIGPDRPQNGLTEAPCGRCPVFDLCEDGGPVSAANCEYFQAWLGLS